MPRNNNVKLIIYTNKNKKRSYKDISHRKITNIHSSGDEYEEVRQNGGSDPRLNKLINT